MVLDHRDVVRTPTRRSGPVTFSVRCPRMLASQVEGLLSSFPLHPGRCALEIVITRDEGAAGSQPGWQVWFSDSGPMGGIGTGELGELLLTHLRRRWLDANHVATHLHAAAAVVEDGTLLLVGGSCAGKSSVIARVGERGGEVLTDEMVAIDPEAGQLAGFPQPVLLRPPVMGEIVEAVRSELCTARSTTPTASGTCRVPLGSVRIICFPAFNAAAPTRMETVDPPTAFRRLLEHSYDAIRNPLQAVAALAGLVCQAPSITLSFGDSAEAADRLLDAIRVVAPSVSNTRWCAGTPSIVSSPGVVEGVIAVVLDERITLVAPHTHKVVTLNRSATGLWQEMVAGHARVDRFFSASFASCLIDAGVLCDVSATRGPR